MLSQGSMLQSRTAPGGKPEPFEDWYLAGDPIRWPLKTADGVTLFYSAGSSKSIRSAAPGRPLPSQKRPARPSAPNRMAFPGELYRPGALAKSDAPASFPTRPSPSQGAAKTAQGLTALVVLSNRSRNGRGGRKPTGKPNTERGYRGLIGPVRVTPEPCPKGGGLAESGYARSLMEDRMTEEEAKAKWCPFVRVAGRVTYNRALNDSPVKHTACIGAACMAWRLTPASDWVEQFVVFLRSGRSIDAIRLYRSEKGATLKDAKEFVDGVLDGTQPMPASQPVGFCGLAGKP